MSERGAGTTAEVAQLWEEFHQVVNMPSEQLRGFLMSDAADERGVLPDEPDLGMDSTGRRIVEVLMKRKVDLTRDDVALMEQVSQRIRALTADGEPTDAQRRHELMRLGHDPLTAG